MSTAIHVKQPSGLGEIPTGRMAAFFRERGALLLLGLFVSFLVVSAVYWMEANTAPPAWDQSWYLETSERLWTTLRVQGFVAFLDAVAHAFSGIKAPLISLLPLPFYFTIGHGKLAVELTLLVIIVLFSLILFKLVRVIAGPWQALIAVIVTNTMPLVLGLSREFLVEYGLMTLVTLWMLLLIGSRGFRVMRSNIGLGIVSGLGLLMKANFPLYVFGPAAFVLYRRWREDGFDAKTWGRDLGVVAIIGLLIAGIWYAPNFLQVFGFAFSATFGQLSLDYSIRASSADPLTAFLSAVGEYWTVVINLAASTYYAIIFAAALLCSIVLIVLSKRLKHNLPERAIRHDGSVLLLLWFILPFFVSTLSNNKDYRYVLPALPALGIGIALLLFRALPWRRVRAFVLPLLLVFPFVLFINITFPQISLPYIANQRWIFLSNNLSYAHRPVNQTWPHLEIINAVLADAKKHDPMIGPSRLQRVLLVVDLNYYNQNNFSYYSAYLNAPLIFSALLTRDEEEWRERRDYLLHSEYALTKETGDQGPPFTIFMNARIREELANGTLAFVPVTRFRLPDGSDSILYRNTKVIKP